MKRIISMTLVILLVASLFVGCAGSATVDGTYKIKSINDKSVKDYFSTLAETLGMDLDGILELFGTSADALEDMMTITLNKDGTCTVASKMADEESGTGTWTQDGDKVTITVDDQPSEFTFKNGTLTMTMEEDGQKMTMVLAKVLAN